MKTAISTLACDGWTLQKSLEQCKKNGIEALEIRMGIHDWSKENLTDDEYREIYNQIQESGLKVSDLGTGVVVTGYKEETLTEIENCARIARLWNCKGLRIMLGHFRTRWSDKTGEVDYEGLLQWLRKADQIMESYGTQIWIETHNEFASAKILMKLLADASVKNYRLIWDIMHPLEDGESPETTLELMGDMLVHVHIKDGSPWDDPDMACYKYTKLGEGSIPIPHIIAMLKEKGYDGYYSLEWEGIWREELKGPGFEAETVIEEFARMMRL